MDYLKLKLGKITYMVDVHTGQESDRVPKHELAHADHTPESSTGCHDNAKDERFLQKPLRTTWQQHFVYSRQIK